MLLRNSVHRLFAATLKDTRTATACRSLSSINEDNVREKYDVIIAGGGMVGCTLACAMGKNSLLSNLKVLLLEGSPMQKFELKPEYSNRVVALNQNTKSLMNSLKIWRHVEKARLQPVRHMQVWDACSDALISFDSADMSDDDLAYIVENDLLLHAVNTELMASDIRNVKIVYGAKIADYQLAKSTKEASTQNLVKMSNGDVYACDLLIGADGANSAVRKAMGVQYLSWNYDQMGVVATLHLAEEVNNDVAWQRWLPTGPVALLPLDATRSSLVWSTWQDNAKELLKLSDESFVDALNDALWKQYPRSSSVDACMSWLGSWLKRAGLPDGEARQLPPSIKSIAPKSRAAFPLGFGHSTRYIAPGVALVGSSSLDVCISWLKSAGLPDGEARQLPPSIKSIAPNSRAAFPLGFGHSTRYIAPGVALVGDAAHRVHPLAGQGVNLGFGDVKDLTTFLADSIYTGFEITHHSWLQKYESSRQRHNVPTQIAVDALHRLYTLQLPPAVLARSLGLQLTNALHPVKKMLISHATT